MMGDDGAGPLLAEMRGAAEGQLGCYRWRQRAGKRHCGDSRTSRLQRSLLIVDATDMGLNPGEISLSIRMISPKCL